VWIFRALADLGLFALVGQGIAVGWLRAPGSRVWRLAWGLVAIGVGGEVFLTVRSLADGWDWDTFRLLLDTGPGRTQVLRLLAATLLLTGRRWTTVLGAGCFVLACIWTSHAGASASRLAETAEGLHVLGALLWAGPLLYLAAIDPPLKVIERFSRLALPAVMILSVAGGLLGWIQLGRVGALVSSFYGRVLTAKVLCVLLALALAGLNRQRFLPAGNRRALRRGLILEGLLVLVVFQLTGLLVTSDPPTQEASRSRVEACCWRITYA
jgi:putative copper export protein